MKNETKYNQLNILTFIAMIMIFTIHYFNKFGSSVDSFSAKALVAMLRGIALIAVPIFVANISYTHLFLEKKISFKKCLLYIIIPTLLLTQFNSIVVGRVPATWNISDGFSGSWFGDMYIGLMISMPLIKKIYSYRSNKLVNYLIFIIAVIVTIIAYYISIKQHSATLLSLGNLIFIPYLSMAIIYDYILFRFNFTNKTILIVCLIVGVLLQALAYYPNDIISNKYLVTSYFSPITYLYTFAFFKLIYNSKLKINGIRFVSQTSYFFYFAHYTIIGFFMGSYKTVVQSNVLKMYPVGIILSFLVAIILYYIYKNCLKVLQLEDSEYSI